MQQQWLALDDDSIDVQSPKAVSLGVDTCTVGSKERSFVVGRSTTMDYGLAWSLTVLRSATRLDRRSNRVNERQQVIEPMREHVADDRQVHGVVPVDEHVPEAGYILQRERQRFGEVSASPQQVKKVAIGRRLCQRTGAEGATAATDVRERALCSLMFPILYPRRMIRETA
jgi:hypothetical protein